MTPLQTLISLGENVAWPDRVTQRVIAGMVARTARKLDNATSEMDRQFAAQMADYPIAVHTAVANAQHYELPPEFFALVLGPQRKYSCCLYDPGTDTLAAAEQRALAVTAEHAGLADGQRILELGCGWGALSLWMARQYPAARIVAVSNSSSQRTYIVEAARRHEITNLDVITADMNGYQPNERFDRIVSVEMFEHMANWHALLQRMRDCLKPDGRLFMHVFSHPHASYRFSAHNKSDWIAQHYFTGGLMPSHDLIRHFADCFTVEAQWRWSGRHYQRTAQDWLRRFDRNIDSIWPILKRVYGPEARVWRRRWRLFFLATAGLFGHDEGKKWGVSHYCLVPTRQAT